MPGTSPSHNVSGPWSQLTMTSSDLAPSAFGHIPDRGFFFLQGPSPPRLRQTLPIKARTERLGVLRHGKAEHHEIEVPAIRWLVLLMTLSCDPLAIALTAAASARR